MAHHDGQQNDSKLHVVAKNGTKRLAQYLIEELKVDIEAKNDQKQTALHYSTFYDNVEVTHFLVERGANLYARNNLQNTPLHRACFRGNTSIVELLLQNGACPNVVNEYKDAPMHNAAWKGHPEVIKILLKYGADPSKRNKWDNTPLDVVYHYQEGDHLQCAIILNNLNSLEE